MNKIILMGRLTMEPQITYTNGDNPTTIARISVAVNKKYKRKGESETDFFNCTAFGKQAEFIEKYLRKGIKVLITGRLQNNNYTNRNGEKVYGVIVMIEEIEFAESKNSNSEPDKNRISPEDMGDGFMNIPDGVEDVPFS